MNKTRRAFLRAGSIIAIVASVFFVLLGISCVAFAPLVTTDNLCDIYESDTEDFKTHYVNDNKEDGIDYFVELNDRGEETRTIIYINDLAKLAKITRIYLKGVGWVALILGIASFVTAIFVLKEANRLTNRIAAIVTLLVLSLSLGNLLTFAFMIVGLCLKNKPIEQILSEQTANTPNEPTN